MHFSDTGLSSLPLAYLIKNMGFRKLHTPSYLGPHSSPHLVLLDLWVRTVRSGSPRPDRVLKSG